MPVLPITVYVFFYLCLYGYFYTSCCVAFYTCVNHTRRDIPSVSNGVSKVVRNKRNKKTRCCIKEVYKINNNNNNNNIKVKKQGNNATDPGVHKNITHTK